MQGMCYKIVDSIIAIPYDTHINGMYSNGTSITIVVA
jgi:hypothetical protein